MKTSRISATWAPHGRTQSSTSCLVSRDYPRTRSTARSRPNGAAFSNKNLGDGVGTSNRGVVPDNAVYRCTLKGCRQPAVEIWACATFRRLEAWDTAFELIRNVTRSRTAGRTGNIRPISTCHYVDYYRAALWENIDILGKFKVLAAPKDCFQFSACAYTHLPLRELDDWLSQRFLSRSSHVLLRLTQFLSFCCRSEFAQRHIACAALRFAAWTLFPALASQLRYGTALASSIEFAPVLQLFMERMRPVGSERFGQILKNPNPELDLGVRFVRVRFRFEIGSEPNTGNTTAALQLPVPFPPVSRTISSPIGAGFSREWDEWDCIDFFRLAPNIIISNETRFVNRDDFLKNFLEKGHMKKVPWPDDAEMVEDETRAQQNAAKRKHVRQELASKAGRGP
ncbi:hypothetical protein DFH06DRAFT_1147032 [Mycena polygramma]|nr:hypothetical protein DFH06DRAFT_1147032 [Mycena polygramma]